MADGDPNDASAALRTADREEEENGSDDVGMSSAVASDDGAQVFVSGPQGQPVAVGPVSLADDVTALRRQLLRRRGPGDTLGSHALRLQFAGRQLEAGVPLRDYGVRPGSTLYLPGNLPGGAQLGKVVKGRSQVKKRSADRPKEYADLQAKNARIQEMEVARTAAVTARRELRARMDVEARNSKVNRLKIQNQWRKIMRLAKVESLRKDIEILSQNHERDVDRKDAIIQMLDRDLEEAEDQFQAALRAHLQTVDGIVDLHDSRLLAMERDFGAELATLRKEFTAEAAQVARQHAADRQELNDVITAVEAQEAEREAEARQDHEQMREEARNKSLEEINVLRITLDSHIEELEQHFEAAHVAYLQNTDQRTADFRHLTACDRDLSREIETKMARIERLQSSLQHWRAKIAQNVRENAERNAMLTEERNAIQAHFQRLKTRMNAFRDGQSRRLADLTRDARAAKERLRRQAALAERILTLAELARKAETEQEKVAPFSVSGHSDEVEREAAAALHHEKIAAAAAATATTAGSSGHGGGGSNGGSGGGGFGGAAGTAAAVAAGMAGGDSGGTTGVAAASDMSGEAAPSPLHACAWDVQGRPVGKWNHLDNFYKRFNKVLLDKVAVEREQARLERENADLRAIIKQCVDGVSVNDDVLSQPNPLLVVNGRINVVTVAAAAAATAAEGAAGGAEAGGKCRSLAGIGGTGSSPPRKGMRGPVIPAIEATHMVATRRVNTLVPL